MFEGESMPQLRPSLFVKCPTADKNANIGTGEFDMGLGLEASKWFGKINLMGELFYVYQGKADGWGLKNYLGYKAGVGYQLTDDIRPRLLVKGDSGSTDYGEVLFEARAQVVWSFSKTTALDLFVARGFTDSSPDFGSGISVVYTF